ncbi:MAG: hypothetical protein M1379_09640 [Firmicutes bacterium]|nr:hypothetical protein [Bacillota bacterium]
MFLSLGLSGVGLSMVSALTPYRRVFMALTVVLLAISHYLVYKKARKGTSWTSQTILWAATILTVAILAYTIKNQGL